MPPRPPEPIKVTSSASLSDLFKQLKWDLQEPETEDSWERLDRALTRLELLTKGGGYKFEEYVGHVKSIAEPIVNSLLSDRTRLSGTAADLLNSVAPRLGERFDALVPLFVPALLQLCARTNKVAVKRAEKCLLLIVKYCKLPSLTPHFREAAKDKAQGLRTVAVECMAALIEAAEKERLGKRVADVEMCVKSGATDSNPEVRQLSKRLFELYMAKWPERVEQFTAPLTPTIRRYLALPKKGAAMPTGATAAASSISAAGPPAHKVRAPPKALPSAHASTNAHGQPQPAPHGGLFASVTASSSGSREYPKPAESHVAHLTQQQQQQQNQRHVQGVQPAQGPMTLAELGSSKNLTGSKRLQLMEQLAAMRAKQFGSDEGQMQHQTRHEAGVPTSSAQGSMAAPQTRKDQYRALEQRPISFHGRAAPPLDNLARPIPVHYEVGAHLFHSHESKRLEALQQAAEQQRRMPSSSSHASGLAQVSIPANGLVSNFNQAHTRAASHPDSNSNPNLASSSGPPVPLPTKRSVSGGSGPRPDAQLTSSTSLSLRNPTLAASNGSGSAGAEASSRPAPSDGVAERLALAQEQQRRKAERERAMYPERDAQANEEGANAPVTTTTTRPQIKASRVPAPPAPVPVRQPSATRVRPMAGTSTKSTTTTTATASQSQAHGQETAACVAAAGARAGAGASVRMPASTPSGPQACNKVNSGPGTRSTGRSDSASASASASKTTATARKQGTAPPPSIARKGFQPVSAPRQAGAGATRPASASASASQSSTPAKAPSSNGPSPGPGLIAQTASSARKMKPKVSPSHRARVGARVGACVGVGARVAAGSSGKITSSTSAANMARAKLLGAGAGAGAGGAKTTMGTARAAGTGTGTGAGPAAAAAAQAKKKALERRKSLRKKGVVAVGAPVPAPSSTPAGEKTEEPGSAATENAAETASPTTMAHSTEEAKEEEKCLPLPQLQVEDQDREERAEAEVLAVESDLVEAMSGEGDAQAHTQHTEQMHETENHNELENGKENESENECRQQSTTPPGTPGPTRVASASSAPSGPEPAPASVTEMDGERDAREEERDEKQKQEMKNSRTPFGALDGNARTADDEREGEKGSEGAMKQGGGTATPSKSKSKSGARSRPVTGTDTGTGAKSKTTTRTERSTHSSPCPSSRSGAPSPFTSTSASSSFSEGGESESENEPVLLQRREVKDGSGTFVGYGYQLVCGTAGRGNEGREAESDADTVVLG